MRELGRECERSVQTGTKGGPDEVRCDGEARGGGSVPGGRSAQLVGTEETACCAAGGRNGGGRIVRGGGTDSWR